MAGSSQILCPVLLLSTGLTLVDAAGDLSTRYPRLGSTSVSKLANQSQAVISFMQQRYPGAAQGKPSPMEMLQIAGLCGAAAGLLYILRLRWSKSTVAPSSPAGTLLGEP